VDYYPLTFSLWWLEWRVWGANPIGYHVVNLLLHIGNALLIWRVLSQLRIPGVWFAALVFAIHPVNVTSVAWITEHKNTLSMLFFLLSLAAYLKFDEGAKPRWYLLAFAAFVLALLSKTSVVMLPCVLLLCAWWRRERIDRRDIWRSVPFFAAAIVLGLVTVWFQYHNAMGGQPARSDGVLERIAGAGWAIWFYIFKVIAPVKLSMVYPDWEIHTASLTAWIPLAALLACGWVCWRYRGSWGRPILFALGYFIITLLPVLRIFDQSAFRFTLVADQWVYLSIVGIISLVVATGATLQLRLQFHLRHLMTGFAAFVLCVLLFQTSTRAALFNDALTLWRDTVATNPNSSLAHVNLGIELTNRSSLDEAAAHYREALRLKPDEAEAHNNLGAILLLQRRFKEAESHFRHALRVRPHYANAHFNLARAMSLIGNFDAAINHFMETVKLRPSDVQARCDLAEVLLVRGKVLDAIEQYRLAARLNPESPEPLGSLARIFAQHHDSNLRDGAEAVRLGERACELTDYNHPMLLSILASAYAEVRRFQDAITTVQKALLIANKSGREDLSALLEEQLNCYRVNQPYHMRPAQTQESLP
jgi:tetratricopeptide (TPR) repeat protein